MGFLDSLLGIIGFGIGTSIGLVAGFFVFVYFESRDVKEAEPHSLNEFDSSSLFELFHKLPLWVMNPDYERVDWLNKFINAMWPYFDKVACEIIKSAAEPIFAEYVGSFKIKSITFKITYLPLWVMNPDYERVDWLNKFINAMWPYFDKVACEIIKSAAEPIFAEYVGSFKIKSITFDHLTLGTLPPTIHGLKAQESNENQLVLDLALRWAGNSDIVLAIKLSSLELHVQLVDLQISAATRLFLRPFVPTFPCFSSVAVSLMEKPQIDFGLRFMGGDIMAIPGLYQIVQEIVSKQVAKLYLWPQTYELDILDSSIGATKKPVGILHVKIVRARKLLNKDFLTTSDPYVKLSLMGERLPAKRTSVKMNNLNPEWNEDFKLIVKDPQAQVLQLHLYDWEKVGAHDYLGMQVIPLNLLTPYEKKELTLDLLNSTDASDPHNKKPRGTITLETTFIPFLEDSKKFSESLDHAGNGSSHSHASASLCGTGLLQVTVIRAEDVEGKHSNNPYATILFRGEQRKTKSIKKTRNPYWNEEFEFVLEQAPLKDLIHIGVVSKRRRFGITSKESLGYVEINLADIVYNGHVNEKFHLIDSRDGIIHLELRWKVI